MPEAPIDLGHLNEVTDNDQEFQKELFVLFAETAESCLQSLQSLCANENAKEWRAKAHELKGSSANLGANTLAHLCKQAMDAESASADQKKTLSTAIQEEYNRVKDFFHKHVA